MGPGFVHTHGVRTYTLLAGLMRSRWKHKIGGTGEFELGDPRQGRTPQWPSSPHGVLSRPRAACLGRSRATWQGGRLMTVLASMQLVHGGEVGHGVELDSEGVHLQHELVRRL